MARPQTGKEMIHKILGSSYKHKTGVVGCPPVLLRATISLAEGRRQRKRGFVEDLSIVPHKKHSVDLLSAG